MRQTLSKSGNGFSLVELLTVVALIGVLAGLAVHHIGRIFEAAQLSKDERNAQQIVSIYHAARASGLNFDGADLMSTIDNVVTGGVASKGAFAGMYFGLPQLSAEQKDRAAQHIEVAGGALQYVGRLSIEP